MDVEPFHTKVDPEAAQFQADAKPSHVYGMAHNKADEQTRVG